MAVTFPGRLPSQLWPYCHCQIHVTFSLYQLAFLEDRLSSKSKSGPKTDSDIS